MRYYLFILYLLASSSSMAVLGDNEDTGPYPSSSQSLTPSLQQPSSSLVAPRYRTDAPKLPSIEFRTLNFPLEFDAILENPESVISGLKFNFTPTVDQLSHLTNRLPFLKSIDLSDTDVTDDEIAPLAALKYLEDLNLSKTAILNISALANLRELKILKLSKTAVSNISDLANLRELRNLYLINTAILDITSLANQQSTIFYTSVGTLRRKVTPTMIDLFHAAIKELSVLNFITKKDPISLQELATRAANYLHSWDGHSPSLMLYDPDSVRFNKQENRVSCIQRAQYEMKRIPEIQEHFKTSEEFKTSEDFMNLSAEESDHATLIRAEMLASIEGRLIVSKPWFSFVSFSPNLFPLVEKDWEAANKELQSQNYLQVRGFYAVYTEEAVRICHLLCLRYRCKYGVEPRPHIIEALKTISWEVTERDSYTTYGPQERIYHSLKMADSLFRDCSFVIACSSVIPEGGNIRVYNSLEEISHMLQTDQRRLRLYPSLFERLWLQLSSELE